MTQALIFDFDGLIVDTETPALESWRFIYAEYGHTLSLEDWASSLGTNHGFDALEHLIGLVAATDAARAATLRAEGTATRARRLAIKEHLNTDAQPLPGVVSTLEQAASLHLPCAIASSSDRLWVEGWLERLGIRSYFRRVLTADDVARTKPDPELFLKAAMGLDLPPAACLVFEDSPNGILAAHAAGCPVVAVPGPLTRQLALPPVHLVLTSLDAMPLDAIIAAVKVSKRLPAEAPSAAPETAQRPVPGDPKHL